MNRSYPRRLSIIFLPSSYLVVCMTVKSLAALLSNIDVLLHSQTCSIDRLEGWIRIRLKYGMLRFLRRVMYRVCEGVIWGAVKDRSWICRYADEYTRGKRIWKTRLCVSINGRDVREDCRKGIRWRIYVPVIGIQSRRAWKWICGDGIKWCVHDNGNEEEGK